MRTRPSRTAGSIAMPSRPWRSEEHTSELQSLTNLVCRLLLEKKTTKYQTQALCSIPLATDDRFAIKELENFAFRCKSTDRGRNSQQVRTTTTPLTASSLSRST